MGHDCPEEMERGVIDFRTETIGPEHSRFYHVYHPSSSRTYGLVCFMSLVLSVLGMYGLVPMSFLCSSSAV